MYGQMTAARGSNRQPGNRARHFETFAAAAKKHFGGSLEGKLIVSGGMGGMGGAQPLAATMNVGVLPGIEVDPLRIESESRRAIAIELQPPSTRRLRSSTKRDRRAKPFPSVL